MRPVRGGAVVRVSRRCLLRRVGTFVVLGPAGLAACRPPDQVGGATASTPPAAPTPQPTPTVAHRPTATPVPRAAPTSKPVVREVVIGALYPLTGSAAAVGAQARSAIQTMVDIANTGVDGLPWEWSKTGGLPGLNGAKIRVELADHEGLPETGRLEAERLISHEKVHALVGCYQNAVTATASQTAERSKIVFLNPDSPSPALHARGLHWFFRTTPHDGHLTQAMFDLLEDLAKRNVPVKTLGLTYEDTLLGEDSAKLQKELAKSLGHEVVVDIRYRSRSSSLSSEVQQLKAASPEVWMPTSYPGDAILYVKTCKQLDYNPKLVLTQGLGFADPSFLSAVAKDAEGIVTRTHFGLDTAERKPIVRRVNELYKNRSGGQDLAEGPARLLTGLQTLIEAINRAKSIEPEAVRSALLEMTIPADHVIMPWKGIKFGPDGQNASTGVLMQQLHDGAYRTVWPLDLASRELLYPIPVWSARG
jgi:branched-chain amino acid transport system substrate-binding protein